MITVHHLERSRSHRVLWLLEELGVPYELERYPRDPKTMLAPRELRKIHPLGKSPIITDSEAKVTLAESGAILEYLAERFDTGKLVPTAGTPERARCRYWMHYAEGSAMPPLLLKLVFAQMKRRAPLVIRPIAKAIANKVLAGFVEPQLKLHSDWIELELGKSTWLAGEELTIADIQMSFPILALRAAALRDGGGSDRPHIAKFVERIEARPAYQRAIARGGPVLVE